MARIGSFALMSGIGAGIGYLGVVFHSVPAMVVGGILMVVGFFMA